MKELMKEWHIKMYEQTGDPLYHQAAYGHPPGKDLSKYFKED